LLEKEIPFPRGRIPNRLVGAQKQRSYVEVADSLGFDPAELVRAQLLAFFEEEGIKLYDYQEVKVWLSEKKKQAGTTHWCWRPLRDKDIIKDYEWGHYFSGQWIFIDGYYDSKQSECHPYERLVPLQVLEKVAKIQEKFGNRVKFFVSDYANPSVDPFIMVRPSANNSGSKEGYNLVFDVWDEPGFGE
jgi:hypothetical protein